MLTAIIGLDSAIQMSNMPTSSTSIVQPLALRSSAIVILLSSSVAASELLYYKTLPLPFYTMCGAEMLKGFMALCDLREGMAPVGRR